ncbi:MAG: hypothetical protein KME49_25310 [Brasilonema octagenarum HA4186-MV1]|jgi:hypothetical protein|nr:hypothetical protein [Brasilonema octagenarum HA4186-MV1]
MNFVVLSAIREIPLEASAQKLNFAPQTLSVANVSARNDSYYDTPFGRSNNHDTNHFADLVKRFPDAKNPAWNSRGFRKRQTSLNFSLWERASSEVRGNCKKIQLQTSPMNGSCSSVLVYPAGMHRTEQTVVQAEKSFQAISVAYCPRMIATLVGGAAV